VTEKTKTTWKAIGGVLGGLAALVGIIVFLTGKTSLPEFFPPKPKNIGDIYRFGKYDWIVLDIQNGKVLLLAADVLETRAYNDTHTTVTWETCTLRAYLNSTFYESFSEGDRSRIALTRNTNPNNTWGSYNGQQFNTPGGNPTDDYIFLLSVPEMLEYFPDTKLDNSDGDEIDWSQTFSWWLRSPGGFQSNTAIVMFTGSDNYVSPLGNYVNYFDYSSGGVYPALWIKL